MGRNKKLRIRLDFPVPDETPIRSCTLLFECNLNPVIGDLSS